MPLYWQTGVVAPISKMGNQRGLLYSLGYLHEYGSLPNQSIQYIFCVLEKPFDYIPWVNLWEVQEDEQTDWGLRVQ